MHISLIKYYIPNRIKSILLTSIILVSCNAQDSGSNNIKGNWQLISNTSNPSAMYVEIFIDADKIHYYSENGIIPSDEYYLKSDSLYIINWSTKEVKNIGQIGISDDSMKIVSKDAQLVYKKLENRPLLSDLIYHTVNEYEFGPAFFRRKEKMEKLKSKSSMN